MRRVGYALAVLVACSDAPVTTYFANAEKLRHELVRMSGHSYIDESSERDHAAPDEYSLIRRFRADMMGEEQFDVVLSGTSRDYFIDVCRIQIGPDPVRRPLELDFLFRLVETDYWRRHLKATVADARVPIAKLYRIEAEVEGVGVSLRQFAIDGRPYVHFVLDGCGRVVTKNRILRFVDEHDELRFGDESAGGSSWIRDF